MLCLHRVSGKDDSETTIWSMENVLAFVAGIMITVALYELFPEAKRHSSQGQGAFVMGTVLGVAIMVLTEYFV